MTFQQYALRSKQLRIDFAQLRPWTFFCYEVLRCSAVFALAYLLFDIIRSTSTASSPWERLVTILLTAVFFSCANLWQLRMTTKSIEIVSSPPAQHDTTA